ncbi:MAG: CobW family GTP-binding protein [Tumebacillaceae bacterium]
MNDRFDKRIPITMLTGALGSGKTTLLNRILAENHGLKIGVIVNEFGELSIDHHLVTGTNETLIELANGCVCCTVREDLLNAVTQILQREEPVEYIVVETTGLADPRPTAKVFLHEEICEDVRLDSIITVIDGANFHFNLINTETTIDQILAGDLLLLNKIDLMSDRQLAEIREEIEDLNPVARVLETERAEVDLRLLLDVSLHDRKRMQLDVETDGDFVTFDQLVATASSADNHLQREEITSVSFVTDRPFDYERLGAFLEMLPRNIFRGKGILWIEGHAEQLIFHLVGDRSTATVGDPWGEGERQSKLVLIGKRLEQEALLAALAKCVIDR